MAKKDPTNDMKTPPFLDRGESLPRSYAVNRIIAMARDPEHIFVYWDVDGETRVSSVPLIIRVSCLSDGQTWDLEPGGATDNWYFQVASNRTYFFELFARRAHGMDCLAASQETTTPVRHAAENGAEAPAELMQAEKYPLARGRPRPVRIRRSFVATPLVPPKPAAPSAPPKVVPAPTVRAISGAYLR
jgi:hypothetical protein